MVQVESASIGEVVGVEVMAVEAHAGFEAEDVTGTEADGRYRRVLEQRGRGTLGVLRGYGIS